MADLMPYALAWLHGFGGGCFVGLLIGLWLWWSNRTGDAQEVTRG